MFARLSAAARRRPILLAVASGTVKASSADLLVQTTLEQRRPKDLDLRRLSAFTMFGGLWMGLGQYVLYCQLFELLLPARTVFASGGKMLLDQFVHVPFLYFPMFYTVGASAVSVCSTSVF